MGNIVVKDETDCTDKANTYSNNNFDIGVEVFQTSANSRLSSISTLSESFSPLEDALSVTTDSTTTTEYESANENDVCSNHMSSCIDISYDIPFNAKSFKKITQERDLKLADVNSHQVSRSSYTNSIDFSDSEINFYEQFMPAEKENVESRIQVAAFVSSHSNVVEQISTEMNNLAELTETQTEHDFTDVLQKYADNQTNLYNAKLVSDCQEFQIEYMNSSSADVDDSLLNFSETLVTPFVNHDIRHFINDIDTSFENSILQEKSKNIEELANETKLLKQFQYSKSNKSQNFNKQIKIREKNKRKTANEKRKSIEKSMKRNAVQKLKNNSSRSSIEYKDFFIFNYEHVFKEKEKGNDPEGRTLIFDQLSQVLSNALNRVTEVINKSNESMELYEAKEIIDECITFYSISWTYLLNIRGTYPSFFEFTYENTFVFYNNSVRKLEISIVKQFFANGRLYLAKLDNVEFRIECIPRRLHYVADISKTYLDNLTDSLFQIIPEQSLKIMKSINERTSYSNSSCGVQNNVIDVLKIQEDWRDLSSWNSDTSFEFPSLKSEIIECAFQIDNIESEIMNYNENVSEAGPATAADMDNVNSIPFLNDSAELDYISKIGGTGLVAENLRKQSLYVKFDPLVSEDGVSCNGDETLRFNDTINHSNNGLSNDVTLQLNEKNSSPEVTDSKTNENGTVGKLISVTPNKSPRKKKNKTEFNSVEETKKMVTPRSSPRFPETDPDDVSKYQSLLLKQMKKEEAFKEEIETVKRDYEQVLQKLENTEKEMSQLKVTLESVQENEKKLKNELMERIKSKQQLNVVMGEYEKTISQMLTKREEEKKEFDATIKKLEAERDSTVQHLNNLENAFNDIHQKYERGKAVNEALKKNEDLLKKSLSEYETTVKTVENKYELLKSHATSQLEKANQELELITQSYEKEQAKLKALLRKSEIQINSLQNALDRKTKENQELTSICDELIVKLSTHSNA